MALSEIGSMVNDLTDAGFRFDWPGMTCSEHPGGRAVAVFHRDQTSDFLPDFVVPCQPDDDAVIRTAYDMITFPGGQDAWFAQFFKDNPI